MSSPVLNFLVSGASLVTISGLVYRFLQPTPARERKNEIIEETNQIIEPEKIEEEIIETPPVEPAVSVSDEFSLSSVALPTPPIRSGISKTALYIAAGRAIESSKPQNFRLFFDPFAAAFAGNYGRAMLRAMAAEMRSPERTLADYVAVRTKFLDNQLISAVEGGIEQIVILGVGGDCRSIRLPLPANVKVFEVDLDETIQYRREIIEKVSRELAGTEMMEISKATIHSIAADVRFPSWVGALESGGFNRRQRSFFLTEGLFMYLTNPEVDVILRQIAELTVSHSRIAGDMLNAQYFLHEVVAPILNVWERWSSRPVSGSDLPEVQFASAGWSSIIKQFGQDWETDYGYIPQMAKNYYLKEKVRGDAKDIPRNWLFIAERN